MYTLIAYKHELCFCLSVSSCSPYELYFRQSCPNERAETLRSMHVLNHNHPRLVKGTPKNFLTYRHGRERTSAIQPQGLSSCMPEGQARRRDVTHSTLERVGCSHSAARPQMLVR